jgi:hypothetical protein
VSPAEFRQHRDLAHTLPELNAFVPPGRLRRLGKYALVVMFTALFLPVFVFASGIACGLAGALDGFQDALSEAKKDWLAIRDGRV